MKVQIGSQVVDLDSFTFIAFGNTEKEVIEKHSKILEGIVCPFNTVRMESSEMLCNQRAVDDITAAPFYIKTLCVDDHAKYDCQKK